MKTPYRSRRQFLRDLGLGTLAGAALPYIPLMEREAYAAAGRPRRLIIIVHGNGTYQRFVDKSGTLRTTNQYFPTGTTFDLNTAPILRPLLPYQGKTVVVEGLSHTLFRAKTGGDEHTRACRQVLTGVHFLNNDTNGQLPGGPSIDQVMAGRIQAQLRQMGLTPPPVKAIAAGVVSSGGSGPSILAAGPGQSLPIQLNPTALYNSLLGGFTPPPGDNSTPQKKMDERKAVFSAVQNRLNAIANKVGTADKRKLDAHLTNLSDLEDRLEGLTNLAAGCNTNPVTGQGADSFTKDADTHFQIIARAFACDLSRVAVFKFGQESLSFLGTPDQTAHNLSHEAPKNKNGATARQVQVEIRRMQLVAKLCDYLSAVPEMGGTMLDNSLVVVTSDMGSGDHYSHKVPTIIIGGGAGALTTGRHLKVGGSEGMLPFNNFHVALFRLMGFTDVSTFGDPDVCTGSVPGLA